LTEDERKEFIEFADSETMLNSIRQEIASHPVHQSRLTMCCKKIASLADTLSPFFEIVEIFIQNNPRYVGLAWGAMRLVFHVSFPPGARSALYHRLTVYQLGSNYISFLEKLSHMFEVIASKLSVYEEHARILQARAVERKQQVSIRLIKALAYIYSDIIQFCQYSCNLFAKRKGI
jgi:predicted O-linked N-acetylglucosamine transferase (SPINDLY family)